NSGSSSSDLPASSSHSSTPINQSSSNSTNQSSSNSINQSSSTPINQSYYSYNNSTIPNYSFANFSFNSNEESIEERALSSRRNLTTEFNSLTVDDSAGPAYIRKNKKVIFCSNISVSFDLFVPPVPAYIQRNTIIPSLIKDNTDKLQKFVDFQNSLSKKSEKSRIVLFIPQKAGYGNIIYGIISSLVAAILTDSLIFIRWPEVKNFVAPPITDLFDEPKFLKEDYLTIIDNFSLNDWLYEKKFRYIVNKTILLEKKGYIYKDIRPFFFTLCSNEIYFEKLLDFGLVEAKMVKLARIALKNDKMNEQLRIDQLYSIGFDVGSNLLNKIWKLKPNIQYYVDKICREHFENNFIIGMQFRFEYISPNDVPKFIECSHSIVKSLNVTKVKWFVSSDNEKILIFLKNYSHLIINSFGKIGHIVNDKSNYFRTILDNELLSKSNEMIISGGSTFGFVAALRKHELPYFVE
ncbi:hypothetical protein BpHYR1_034358, partial [Brachionus plicatilis]